MGDWLTKARTVVSGTAGVAEPEPFERPCVCGETLVGVRLPQAQEVPCPSCGREWFILPRDVYPKARRRSSKPSLLTRLTHRSGTARQSSSAETTIDVDNATATSLTSPGATNGQAGKARTKQRALTPRVPIREQVKQKIAAVGVEARDRLKRGARPIRLVSIGILLALIGTGFWMWHRSRLDAAAATLVTVVPQAEHALEERDLAAAERLLAEAVSAVELLGSEDVTARRLRQRHREVVASSHLAAQTPYDLAAEAERLSTSPGQWAERFQASVAGRWVILDVPLSEPQATIVPLAESDESSSAPAEQVYRLDLPLLAGSYAVQFEIPTEGFPEVEAPARAIFAAQYESWHLVPLDEDAAVWVVRLRPQTAFLWTSPDIYSLLGFDLDDPAAPPRAVLARQTKALGLETSSKR